MEPYWSNLWATWSQLGPTWSQLGPNMAQHGPKMADDAGLGRPSWGVLWGSWGGLGASLGLLKGFRTSDHIFDRFFTIFHRFFVDLALIFWIQVVLKSIKHQSDADLRRSTQLGECPLFLLRNQVSGLRYPVSQICLYRSTHRMCGAGVYACVFNPAPHPCGAASSDRTS